MGLAFFAKKNMLIDNLIDETLTVAFRESEFAYRDGSEQNSILARLANQVSVAYS